MNSNKPWYVPDTQGFLAVAIIVIISVIILILLLHPLQITDTVNGVLMTLIGVLAAELKDVYAFYFNSTSSSKAKDETLKAVVQALPSTPSTTTTTTTEETSHAAVH